MTAMKIIIANPSMIATMVMGQATNAATTTGLSSRVSQTVRASAEPLSINVLLK